MCDFVDLPSLAFLFTFFELTVESWPVVPEDISHPVIRLTALRRRGNQTTFCYKHKGEHAEAEMARPGSDEMWMDEQKQSFIHAGGRKLK